MKKHLMGAALEELYRCFDVMNNLFYDNKLPEPIILIQKGKKNVLSTCSTKKIWCPSDKEEVADEEKMYEITLVADNLNRPVEDIVGTLAHEMVHYFNLYRGVKGAKSRKHNDAFKNEAERIGLICNEEEGIGWGITEVGESLAGEIRNTIKPNAEVFKYFRYTPTKERKKTDKPSMKKYKCPKCDVEIKGKEGLDIICNDCKSAFIELP